jgi:hypothetical protein
LRLNTAGKSSCAGDAAPCPGSMGATVTGVASLPCAAGGAGGARFAGAPPT